MLEATNIRQQSAQPRHPTAKPTAANAAASWSVFALYRTKTKAFKRPCFPAVLIFQIFKNKQVFSIKLSYLLLYLAYYLVCDLYVYGKLSLKLKTISSKCFSFENWQLRKISEDPARWPVAKKKMELTDSPTREELARMSREVGVFSDGCTLAIAKGLWIMPCLGEVLS